MLRRLIISPRSLTLCSWSSHFSTVASTNTAFSSSNISEGEVEIYSDTVKEGVAAEEAEDILTPAQSAFRARLKLEDIPDAVLLQALTHKSFEHARQVTNERLEFLGRKVCSLYVTEHLHFHYPVLPILTLKDALDAYCNVKSLAKLGHELGVPSVVRWKPAVGITSQRQDLGLDRIVGKAILALVGGLYHVKGSRRAKYFINDHVLSRQLDVASLVKLEQPKRLLTALLKRKAMERPISRLLRETGRNSNAPLFVVGVYSGTTKLGEGMASTLKMAEFRAAKDAIISYFITQVKDVEVLPSDVETEEAELSFFPPMPADSDVVL